MSEHGKYCPIMVAGGNMQISGVCIGKDCAWWLPFANDCALPTVAGILADSTICQNVFEQEDTMHEYIEREVAIKELMNDAPEQVGYSREDAVDCIRYMDAADVAPVRHGKWEIVIGSDGKQYMVCSECRVSQTLTGVFSYCPNCGAKMDVDEKC